MNEYGQPDSGRTTATGATTGAVLGGLIGGLSGKGKGKNILLGAAIGAILGGAAGYIYGKEREREYKSAEQIYRERPALASRAAANEPPRVALIVPIITNSNGKPVRVIKGGDTVVLGTKYDIVIPKYSDIREVEVVEINTLKSPNGVTTDEKRMTRVKRRPCQGVECGISVTIPENSPEGIYTHHAVVKIAGQKYENQRKIQMVRVDGKMHLYALN